MNGLMHLLLLKLMMPALIISAIRFVLVLDVSLCTGLGFILTGLVVMKFFTSYRGTWRH
jgi:hypothetical protein